MGQPSAKQIDDERFLDIEASPDETIDEDVSAVDRSHVTHDMEADFGRYQIVRKIGEGGMGSVFLANDSRLDRVVALKIPSLTRSDKNRLSWFYREARSMATVRHPGICPIYDVGVINERHYLTMAYIEGCPLSDILQDGEPLSFETTALKTSAQFHDAKDSQASPLETSDSVSVSNRQVALLIRKLASALFVTHEAGIVHRDLKPSNIMIDLVGEPKILDFGVAHREATNEIQLTKTGVTLGTPYYMAPEQVEGDPRSIGAPTDIYALGVIMYQTLCGKLPFEGTTIRVLTKIVTTRPCAPSTILAHVDPELERICQKAMARHSADRYSTAAKMVAELDRWLEPCQSLSPPVVEPQPTASTANRNSTYEDSDDPTCVSYTPREESVWRESVARARPFAFHLELAATGMAAAYFAGASSMALALELVSR